jgi:RES domain-containing protein
MGQAKSELMRDWNAPDNYVCAKCVDDDFLKKVIRNNVNRQTCDYCQCETHTHSATPVSALMEHISNTVFYHFNNPTCGGAPYDEGCIVEPISTEDVLYELSLSCNDQLFEDIANAFTNKEWIRTASGNWASSHPHEAMSDSWSTFANIVKHEVRFFFQHPSVSKTSHWQEYEPQQILPVIGKLVNRLALLKKLPVNTNLFRARNRNEDENWELNEKQMGAPPPEKASAGRMNPAGISYLYLAYEQETALAEVLSRPPCSAAIAHFVTQQELNILDLTQLPRRPSIFDSARRNELEGIIFLEVFASEISKSVQKNRREHIEYIPSQVVSEYFAMLFEDNRRNKLDGIAYRSSVRPKGRNLVLFPKERSCIPQFDQVIFHQAREQTFSDWTAFSDAIA